MKLYHGTRGCWIDSIMKDGIEPRLERVGRNNWKHVKHQSNRNCVYLSNSYAPFFALNAASQQSNKVNRSCAVIEIETDKLDRSKLFPDEDFLEQAGRHCDGIEGDMSARTLHYRARQCGDHGLYCDGRLANWEDSLQFLGTCSYRGTILPSAITRVVKFPFVENVELFFVFDPSITIMHQRLLGQRYKNLTLKLFEKEFTDPKTVTPEMRMDISQGFLPPIVGYERLDYSHEP